MTKLKSAKRNSPHYKEMSTMNFLKNLKPLIKILSSYIIVLLIPLISILFIYQSSVSVATNSAKREFNNMLNQVKTITDSKLAEIETVSSTLQTYELRNSLANIEKNKDNNSKYYLIYSLSQNLLNLSSSNFLIDEYFIITPNSRYAISSKSALKFDDRFTNYFLKGDMSALDFEKLLFKKDYEYEYVTTNDNELLFLHTIYDSITADVLGTLVIKLDEMFFNNMLNQLDSTDAFFFILNQPSPQNPNPVPVSYYQSKSLNLDYDEVLPLLYSNDILNNHHYISASTTSIYNDWTYYAVSPKKIVLSDVTPVSSVIILLFVISLIFGVVASFFISRNKYSVLKRLLNYVSPNDALGQSLSPSLSNDPDIYKNLELGINSLIDKNNNLTKIVDKQKPLFEAAVLRKLIYADYDSISEISDILNKFPIGNSQNQFIVALVYYNQNSTDDNISISISSTIVKTTLINVFDDHLYILDISNSSFVCLITGVVNVGEDFHSNVLSSLTLARDVLLLESDIRSSFVVSESFDNITTTHTAFEAVQYIDLNACKTPTKFIYNYQDILHISPVLFYYPIDVELELVQLVKYGNSLEVKKLLSTIYEENFVKRNLTSLMAKQLVFAMRCTIIRNLKDLVNDPSITELINNIHSSNSINQIFNNTIRINLLICNIVKNNELQKSIDFKVSIINYINDNFLDSTLSIKSLCKHFLVGESTMYQFFRDNMECSCSELIEKTRIHNACELLKSKEYTITQIALRSGYVSDDSFRRAFKRVLSVSPSDYLKSY